MSIPIPVIHSCYKWLPLTEHWIYWQITNLPPPIMPIVVAETPLNPEQFPWPRLHFLADELRFQRDRLWRKLGWRHALSGLTCHIRRANAVILHTHFGGWISGGSYRGWTANWNCG